MKYSPKLFYDGLPEWKRRKDPILSRVFYRPFSFLLSAFFCEIGWTANAISYFSALVALTSCASFVFGYAIFGAVLLNVWLLLDCADGNIARCVKKEKFGDFADSMSSYICVGLLFACMGFYVCNTGGVLIPPGKPWIVLVGAMAGSSDSLMRLIYQKFQNSAHQQGLLVNQSEDPDQEHGINRLRMKVDQNISLGGILPIAVLCGVIFRFIDVVVCAWGFYYAASFLASTMFLVRKTVACNESEGRAA